MPRTLNELLGIRRKSRAEDQKHQPEERIATFDRRLAMFPTHERQTVSTAVRQAAQIETLSQEQFQELGNTIIDSWERGRLRDLINNVSNTEDPDQLVEIIAEAEILTALNMAEALRTKLKVIAKLQQRIENIDPENNGLENQVREYISQHPWIVSPTWVSRASTRCTTAAERNCPTGAMTRESRGSSKQGDPSGTGGDS